MRPDILTPLFASVRSLTGAGPRVCRRLKKLFAGRLMHAEDEPVLADLLWHFPAGVIDRSYQPDIADAADGALVTLQVTVDEHKPPPAHMRRLPYKVSGHDDSGDIDLVFFHARGPWLRERLPIGEKRFVSGRVEHFNNRVQMVHPDHILDAKEFAALPLIEPVYPLTEGLSNKVLSKLIRAALKQCPDLPEWQDRHWLAQQGWPDFMTALKAVHFPQDAMIDPLDPAHARLAFDELLASQLALALTREHIRAHPGAPVRGDGRLRASILDTFGHELTPGQTEVLGEIYADLAAPRRMLRLLQGDVGAGKTIVALLALATAVEAGFQGALMAPTELLARQHMATIGPLCRASGIRVEILTGRDKGKARAAKIEAVAAGNVDILIGTHALIQDDIAFSRLALAVIDEQHRFGVRQRLALQAKGHGGVDVLVMTATPIPRTLTLAHYGDMDISRLAGRPSGRQAVDTRVLPMTRLDDVVDAVVRATAAGQRAYWVCPLVEDSDVLEVTAAEERYRELVQVLGDQVGLVHGRMKPSDREQIMERFRSGAIAVLVATTVIEVGVDVPEATIMVIEHAERFGLAQLHQLRGRIGRGSGKSTCLLLYQPPLGEIARQRLTTLRDTDDGFVIAEQDLKLRGAGDLLGARQSGLPQFRIADLALHGGLLAAARDDARLILSTDPQLRGPRGPALKTLLYLFRRDSVIHLLASG